MSVAITQSKSCERCGGGMKLRASQARTKYCYECRQQVSIDSKRERRRATLQAMIAVCPICNRAFAQGAQPLVKRQNTYCSPTCIKKAYKIRHRAKVLKAAKAYTNERKFEGNWRRAIARDEEKCVLCGAPFETVHHLDNRGDKCTIVEKNHTLSNLMTLCWPCHRNEHILDWAFDGEALIIKCKAFERLLGRDTIRVSRKEVLI